MAAYNKDDYTRILTQVIKEDTVVPFSCYILLLENDKVICLVEGGQVFSKTKLDRLKSHKFNDLYITKVEKHLYDEYLRQFLNSPEGSEILKDIVEKTKEGSIVGLPDDITSKVRALNSEATNPNVVSGTPPEEEQKTVVDNSAEIEETTKLKQSDDEKDDTSKVVQADTEAENSHSRIVALLKKHADTLDDAFHLADELEDEEITIVKNATMKIEEELQKVKGFKDPISDDDQTVVKSVTESINEELIKVKGVIEKSGSECKALKHHVENLEEKMEELKKLSGSNGVPPDASVRIESVTASISNNVWQLKRTVGVGDKEIVAEEVQEIIGEMESILNAKLILTPKKSGEKEEPVKIGEIDELDLKKQLALQKKIIEDLNKRLTSSQSELIKFKANWDKYRSRTSPSLDSDGEKEADELGNSMEAIHKIYDGAEQRTGLLMNISSDLCKKTKTDNAKQDNDIVLPAISEKQPRTMQMMQSTTAATATKPQAEKKLSQTFTPETIAPSVKTLLMPKIELPPPLDESADIGQLRSENQVLRAQLTDAQSVFENSSHKVKELTDHIEKSGEYMVSLEKEAAKAREESEKLQEKSRKLESDNINFADTAHNSQRALQKIKTEMQIKDTHYEELLASKDQLSRELNMFKEKFKNFPIDLINAETNPEDLPVDPELIALIREKDKMLNKYTNDLHLRRQEMKKMELENAKLNGQIDDVNALKRRMSLKFDQLQKEKENMRNEYDALNRKLIVAANLVESERRTITRMSSLNEDLKKERVEFMGKTNQALKDFRDVLNKANNLNSHVQSEAQKNKKLSEQFEAAKKKQREYQMHASELEKKLKQIEDENKRLKKKLGSEAA